MDARTVRQRLLALNEELRDLRVSSLSLFGSAARGLAGPESDLDFLVEFDGAATFNGFMGLKELLEREFSATKIDLVTKRALKPALRDRILAEAVRVA